MFIENERTEFKSTLTDGIYKEIIAFANTDGGIIYVGIDDNGNPIGLDKIDEKYTSLTNGIRDAIQPDVTMFVRYTLEDNKVIRIEVNEGSYKPYYLKSKGLKPAGVYVRQGASSVPASTEQIRQMIKLSDGNVFEEMRSTHQELTFNAAEAFFKKYNTDFSKEKFINLGIINSHDGQYTNLAWIISDQCQHTTKIAVFADKENTSFKDSKEFNGSIFTQLEGAFDYLLLCNRTSASFKGIERIEKKDYQEETLREALLNALVHRDYSFSGSIIINVNDACIEFISMGGLPSGLSEEDIKNGISQPRNRKLAEIFHRLRLIESYGTGIRRIFSFYKDLDVKPCIDSTANTFKIMIPNMNYRVENTSGIDIESKTDVQNVVKTPNFQMQQILNHISINGSINDQKIQDLLNIKKTRSYLITKQMVEEGLICSVGKGSEKIFVLNDNKK